MVGMNSNLARQPELPQDAIFFQAILLFIAHRRLRRQELDSASSAASVASAAVADVDTVLLDRKRKFRIFFNRKCLPVGGDLIGGHVVAMLRSSERRLQGCWGEEGKEGDGG